MSIFSGVSGGGWGSGWTHDCGGSIDGGGSADPPRGPNCGAVALSSARSRRRLCLADSSLGAGGAEAKPGNDLAGAIGGVAGRGGVSDRGESGCSAAVVG
jgi:hypothetical protein